MIVADFRIKKVHAQWLTGDTTEHTYRGMLGEYIQSIIGSKFIVVNEPSRIKCGAPDYVVMRTSDHQPVFYIEAKDIGDGDLDGRNPKGHREQFDRYKGALEHIVFTDYLDFHFYEHGQWIRNIRLADIQGNKIVTAKDSEQEFTEQISQWSRAKVQPITGASRLADIMASKARLLRHVTESTMKLMTDEATDYQDSQLLQLFNAFKGILVSDLTVEGFADMYAQTIVYGLFAARLHDTTPEDFSREEAARLIPKTNPFLRRIFNNIAGIDLDDRVAWIVDDLVETFAATDVAKVMKDYGRNDHRNDPMVHFYEDFLTRYDAQLRKDMGVWYTPKPVVGFIVRSVHELLKSQFNMPQGLADTSKIKDKNKHEVHRLQILDIATGTATFLAEVIMVIYDVVGQRNKGLWQDYVEKELKPRLNGFEIMMAPYTIAHLKLDMVLHETGYDSNDGRRLNVFLTNSLEPPSLEPRTFWNAISMEAEEADKVKRDKPVMVIVGNPPYNISSTNKGKWIMGLINDYKKNLGEKNIQPLSDDYIKFIRLAQYYIDKNGSGIVGFITNNTYIDGIIHRQMRKSLLESFDKIYILDLHGNAKKRETAPDGSKDENVFNIMQGVGIALFVKTGKKKKGELAEVWHSELYGRRETKLETLEAHKVTNTQWNKLNPVEPYYFFTPKDFSQQEEYNKGFKMDELFANYNNGIESGKDDFFFGFKEKEYKDFIRDCFKDKYNCSQRLGFKDTENYRLLTNFLNANYDEGKIIKVNYRPFDIRFCYYDTSIQRRPASVIMKNMLQKNIALLTPRQVSGDFHHVFASSFPTNCNLTGTAKKFGSAPIFPLYIYKDNMGKEEKVPNFKAEIYNKIADGLGFRPEPEDVFDYIYAVLHSPSYREKYKEFLKIDFPRVPYPKDKEKFEALVKVGHELVSLHLMRGADKWNVTTGFPESGTNTVEKYQYADGKVWINDKQYFSNVSSTAWNEFIGGYQPAQKWLKDRRGRQLSYDDIIHYERIIYVLDATYSIMNKIDNISL